MPIDSRVVKGVANGVVGKWDGIARANEPSRLGISKKCNTASSPRFSGIGVLARGIVAAVYIVAAMAAALVSGLMLWGFELGDIIQIRFEVFGP